MIQLHNEIIGLSAVGPRQLPMPTRSAARIAQLWGNLEVLPQEPFRLTLTGGFGARYQILSSTDL